MPFDPATLGFSPNFISQIPSDPNAHKFPGGDIEGYDQAAGQTFGAITPNSLNYYSNSVNGTFSRFVGTHTYKFGGDYRKVGADFFSPGDGSGFFNFDKAFTSADPRSDGTATSGSSFASSSELSTENRPIQHHAAVHSLNVYQKCARATFRRLARETEPR